MSGSEMTSATPPSETLTPQTNFVRQIVEEDIQSGKFSSLKTRFPPEPNGFLHLGHAKSICLNFGLPRDFGGVCHLRFDDTNPKKEEMRYIESIKEDVRWLGGDWGTNEFYASDYFEQLYQWAVQLVEQGDAYVDHQTLGTIRETRGNLYTPGLDSPYRTRSVKDNLELFERMKSGEFPDGTCVLRAKIDMGHGNMNMRDPIIYRILHEEHPRTGNKWCIYPMYDFAHGQSDSIESITHSICTLEFELHRELYDWLQDKLKIFKTRQIEFARLNCTYTVMSKRKLLTLVEGKHVRDWDDPRLPTISGMRRKGFPPQAIRNFCEKIGVAKRLNTIRVELLECCVRDEMEENGVRKFAVVHPILVEITNFPAEGIAPLEIQNHPKKREMGTRALRFTKQLYIEADDFLENPPSNYHRLKLGGHVRLRGAYIAKCEEVLKDSEGNIEKLMCSIDLATRGGNANPAGPKVKGTIHWLSVDDCKRAEFRLYDRLFSHPNPESPDALEDCRDDTEEEPEAAPIDRNFLDLINPKSLTVVEGWVESSATELKCGDPAQFERVGYFTADEDATNDLLVFNRTIELTDSFTPLQQDDPKLQAKAAEKRARQEAQEKRDAIKQKRKEKEMQQSAAT
eukprot:GHVU01157209.1.p1 GENE.GHVU01157209.1~~GHVU01157209.1.p1  ORF type:complete len:626 (-),score=108.60 GHVU01157209.1:372-2249(-)